MPDWGWKYNSYVREIKVKGFPCIDRSYFRPSWTQIINMCVSPIQLTILESDINSGPLKDSQVTVNTSILYQGWGICNWYCYSWCCILYLGWHIWWVGKILIQPHWMPAATSQSKPRPGLQPHNWAFNALFINISYWHCIQFSINILFPFLINFSDKFIRTISHHSQYWLFAIIWQCQLDIVLSFPVSSPCWIFVKCFESCRILAKEKCCCWYQTLEMIWK